MNHDNELPPPRVTTGQPYTGNQAFKGNGLHRSCAACHQHRITTGGHSSPRHGGLWICADHPKPKTAPARK